MRRKICEPPDVAVSNEPTMTSAMTDAAGSGFEAVGPLERQHLQYANYRAVADNSKVTRTHWHIALANGLGWGFDGMNGVLFELLSPLIIKEFALDIPTFRSGFQIWLSLGTTGLYVWPWLADRFGRRSAARRQYRDVFADDADRSAVARASRSSSRRARSAPSQWTASGRWGRCWSPRHGPPICAVG